MGIKFTVQIVSEINEEQVAYAQSVTGNGRDDELKSGAQALVDQVSEYFGGQTPSGYSTVGLVSILDGEKELV